MPIFIGNTIANKRNSWSSYWKTRFPSELWVAAKSNTEIDLAWTNNGNSDYTGHKVYMSTDGVNYTLKDTIANIGTTHTVIGLTAATHYWFKVYAYKGANLSASTNPNDDVTFPEIMADGNTVMSIFGNDISKITKDSSNRVSKIASRIGSDYNQAGADAIKPSWNMAEGFRFDGTDDFIQTPDIVLNQPITYYSVFKQQTFTPNDRFFDGGAGGGAVTLAQSSGSPLIIANNGIASGTNGDLTMYKYFIVSQVVNGASSSFRVFNFTATSGNFGANNPSGDTIGAARTGAIWANMELKARIVRKIADSAESQTEFYNYLIEKYYTGRNVNMVWEGHSMINLLEVAGDIPVTDYTENKLLLNYGIKFRQSCNVAIGGATIAQMASRYVASVTANKNATAGVKNYLTIFIGANDIATGMSGINAYNALKAYVDQAVVDGWIPIIPTMTKYGTDATVETQRNVFNNLIRANADWDYIVDLDLVPELTDNNNTTYFNADKIHLISAGSERFANALYKKIKEAIYAA